MNINTKIIFAIISSLVGVVSYFPYIRDVLKRKTQPHTYTWLVWVITQGVAATSIWYGQGRWGALGLTIGTFLIFVIFLLSLKFGTKNITRTDTVVLFAALGAIVIWWKLKNPLLALFMVTLIDLLGYIPSFRKSYQQPWSETISSWEGFVIGNFFAILALKEYNLLTLSYLIAINIANIVLILICLFRRRLVPKQLPAS